MIIARTRGHSHVGKINKLWPIVRSGGNVTVMAGFTSSLIIVMSFFPDFNPRVVLRSRLVVMCGWIMEQSCNVDVARGFVSVNQENAAWHTSRVGCHRVYDILSPFYATHNKSSETHTNKYPTLTRFPHRTILNEHDGWVLFV